MGEVKGNRISTRLLFPKLAAICSGRWPCCEVKKARRLIL
jgi:hypothetical protein